MPFVPGIERPPGARPLVVFAFAGDRLLVRADGALPEPATLPLADPLYLGALDGADCLAVDLGGEAQPPPGHELAGLRALHGRLDDELWALGGRAVQVLGWDRTHRFCGRCGTPTERAAAERSRSCPACGLHAYPRVSPAVIALVERGDELLLAHGVNFPEPFYSALAGFVEPGESLEECVRREIREEVGVEVDEVAYFGSQPWPFPHSLMVGFTARWAAGELRVDPTEIVDAGWFRKDALPHVPPPLSIARRLIDAAAARR